MGLSLRDFNQREETDDHERMALAELLEKGSERDLLRETIARAMAGARGVNRPP